MFIVGDTVEVVCEGFFRGWVGTVTAYNRDTDFGEPIEVTFDYNGETVWVCFSETELEGVN